ncbi:MAG: hypothetical protein WC071_11570 [Victivallaceae bacterium]
MSVFLSIGMGPIQTGIFLAGAVAGGYDRVVVADVDVQLVEAVRKSGYVTINIASDSGVVKKKISGLEIYNPLDPEDLKKLIAAAAEAEEISTALPGVTFFKHIAPWLREGMALNPNLRRFIYAAENDNHAAEKLEAEVGLKLPQTYYLNTVIGKMSKVFECSENTRHLESLCPSFTKGHLVEEFNKILIDSPPGIESRKIQGLHPKAELYPFEEAKLFGHNAIHFMLGWYAHKSGLKYMNEISGNKMLLEYAAGAFVNESGRALCRKWSGKDELFTEAGFQAYTDDLMRRMVNPYLMDSVERVIRDLPRKLELNDRVVGTIQTCLSQGVIPEKFIVLAAECFKSLDKNDPARQPLAI